MLNQKMTLKQMLDFMPSNEQLIKLNNLYLKLLIISSSREENYAFLKTFFNLDLAKESFNNLLKTPFFDFDATKVKNSHKFMTICELSSSLNAQEVAKNLLTLLKQYSGKCDLVFDLFTLDNKHYRLSLLEGVKKLEEIDEKTA